MLRFALGEVCQLVLDLDEGGLVVVELAALVAPLGLSSALVLTKLLFSHLHLLFGRVDLVESRSFQILEQVLLDLLERWQCVLPGPRERLHLLLLISVQRLPSVLHTTVKFKISL